MPLSLLLKLWPLYLLIAASVASFIAGYKYSSALCEKERAELIIESEQKLKANVDNAQKVSSEFEQKLKSQKATVRIITKTVEKEVDKPVYQECVVPKTGIDVINAQVEALNSTRGIKASITAIETTSTKLNATRLPHTGKKVITNND